MLLTAILSRLPSHLVEVDRFGAVVAGGDAFHGVLYMYCAGPRIDHPAPRAPASHPLNDVGVDSCLQICRSTSTAKGMGLDLGRREPAEPDSCLEVAYEPGSRTGHCAISIVVGALGEVE